MTLFEDANNPYSDSNTTTLTEPQPEAQPTTQAQTDQADPSAHEPQTSTGLSAEPSDAHSDHGHSGDEKHAAEDFGSVLDSFTAEA
jgi:hypothetical protein